MLKDLDEFLREVSSMVKKHQFSHFGDYKIWDVTSLHFEDAMILAQQRFQSVLDLVRFRRGELQKTVKLNGLRVGSFGRRGVRQVVHPEANGNRSRWLEHLEGRRVFWLIWLMKKVVWYEYPHFPKNHRPICLDLGLFLLMDFPRFHVCFGTWKMWRACKTLLQSCEDTDLWMHWLEDEILFSQFPQMILWCDETRKGKWTLTFLFFYWSSLLLSQCTSVHT